MTRNQKLNKLGNAIREFRGTHEPKPGGIRWRRVPNLHAEIRVRVWLDRLNIDTLKNVERIRNFKTVDEMNTWFQSL